MRSRHTIHKGEHGNAVALTLLGLAVSILAGVVVLYVIGTSKQQPVQKPESSPEEVFVPETVVNPREGWGVFEDTEFGFHIEYPQGWIVATGTLVSEKPVITLSPGVGTTTTTIFDTEDVAPHVSVYPRGVGTSTIDTLNKTKSSNVIIEVPQASAMDYVLKSGKPWATKAVFEKYPALWSGEGFVFARVVVEEELLEYMRGEKQIAEAEYDTQKGDTVERSGFLDSKMRETQEEILRSFRFVTKEEGALASTTSSFVELESPLTNEVISSPFLVRGVVDSKQYTQEIIYIRLETHEGVMLAEVPVSITEIPVEGKIPFEVSIAFDSTTATSGTMILGGRTNGTLVGAEYTAKTPVLFMQ